jgi:hypothetical protein
MKFLCVVFCDEAKLDALSEEAFDDLTVESLDYDDTLRAGGHFLAAQALEPVKTATTLRLLRGKLSITDGPFTETTEQIGGFILIEASDIDEAIQLGSKIPALRFGRVEIRPIKELIRPEDTQAKDKKEFSDVP